MSHLMDYGHDWPPRTTHARRSLLRWLNEEKRRPRPGFDRFFWINTAVIVGMAVVCAIVLRLTDRPSPRLVVGNHHRRPTLKLSTTYGRARHPGSMTVELIRVPGLFDTRTRPSPRPTCR
jgi:hypothetical protein